MKLSNLMGQISVWHVLAVAFAAFVFVVDWPIYAAEDAIILYRYSENLANHGIITYNPMDTKPVEGATDFLWMALLALLFKLNLSSYGAAKLLSMVSLLGIGLILTRVASMHRAPKRFYFLIVCAVALQIPLWAALTGFSPYFFGFSLFISLLAFWRQHYVLTVLFATLSCFIRPDGAFFAAPLMLGYWYLWPESLKSFKNRLVTILCVISGLAYFAWRWSYFGLLLPLPYYVKSDCAEYVFGVFCSTSVAKPIAIIGFYSPLLLLIGLHFKKLNVEIRKKMMVVAIAFIVVPLLIMSTINLTQNIGFRFYFPTMLTFIFLAMTVYGFVRERLFWLAMFACIAFQLPVHFKQFFGAITPVSTLGIAKDLGKLPEKGRLMTSEAGVLAYYSGWETLDSLGLNTPHIAVNRITPEDVKIFDADLIVLADCDANDNQRASLMARNVHKGVSAKDYEQYEIADLYYLPELASKLDWRTVYTQRMKFPVAVWIKRKSPQYGQIKEILLRNGAYLKQEKA